MTKSEFILKAETRAKRLLRKSERSADAHMEPWHDMRRDEELETVAVSVAHQRAVTGATGKPETIRIPLQEPIRRGKRGPKPQAGARELNGQLSRRVDEVISRNYEKLKKVEKETIAVGVETRERLWGVTAKVSRDQLAGTYIGRLKLQGDLNALQYEALTMYAEQCHDYRIAMKAPAEPNAVNLNATKGGSGDYENVHKSQSACDIFERALKALQDANAEPSNRGCNLIGSIAATVLRDATLNHLLNDTRIAANVLARHYGLTAGRKAA